MASTDPLDNINTIALTTDRGSNLSVERNPTVFERVSVRGKFLFAGENKFWIKGVTYGTFRPNEAGEQYPHPDRVEDDFALMAQHGFNTVRTYTPPPRWLLDSAQRHGLRVMVGLSWEQHVAFLDDRELVKTIEGRIRSGVKQCAGHAAVLCFSIGNEIPSSIVRWHGRKRIERFLKRLYHIAKSEDSEALCTYVNFPTTEYLQLPFLDFMCFNVYLERRNELEAYLYRLQNLAGEKPLVMAEIGLDSRRNSEDQQAESLEWQVNTAFATGCAGALVFAWTDEWYRGGFDIEDWDFGLTTRERLPKPALGTVAKAFSDASFPADTDWPPISVVVCSFNGASTIRDTLDNLENLDYPNYEVIVINDGSVDATGEIAGEYQVKLISTENRGLSAARNTGWQDATGEIVAYIDDDAYPDPHWLHYLAHAFMTTNYVGVGGPNIAPPEDGPIAHCVANAPGGPVHVLFDNTEAEHIPGCNMAFRREALEAIGGFDPRYRAAGDDVDLCWRLQMQGWKIGFHPGAMDWHHRRNSLKAYWKQQVGYGKAEAMLEDKWPWRFNDAGHIGWKGRLYGKGITLPIVLKRSRIYQGPQGTALFQSIYQPASKFWADIPLMPEWWLVIAGLALLSLLSMDWPKLSFMIPLFVLALSAPVIQAFLSAWKAKFPTTPATRGRGFALRLLTAVLHLVQPLARLSGRIRHGLTLWRKTSPHRAFWPGPRTLSLWREEWSNPSQLMKTLEWKIRDTGCVTWVGNQFDSWDLEVRGGLLGAARVKHAVEEHGGGKQMYRFRVWPKIKASLLLLTGILFSLALMAFLDGGILSGAVLGFIAIGTTIRGLFESAVPIAATIQSVSSLEMQFKIPQA